MSLLKVPDWKDCLLFWIENKIEVKQIIQKPKIMRNEFSVQVEWKCKNNSFGIEISSKDAVFWSLNGDQNTEQNSFQHPLEPHDYQKLLSLINYNLF